MVAYRMPPPLEHPAILWTFIELPFVIKIFLFCLFFELPFYTGFTILTLLLFNYFIIDYILCI